MERTIRRLDEAVVNRIAAGEIIHRPANALKEIVENSLDAGATSISIQAKAGGTKLLQVADNGHGIPRADLDIVCERFTTSKLQKFEDLETISTFGFRGEALASISHVAHLTITSMTKDHPCAFKAKYIDGKLAPFVPGGSCKPKACAGVIGTQITIEDLFYNVLTRKRALKNPSEEYHKILAVVTRYALHYPSISFSCKKYGESAADIQTPGGTAIETFKVLYGNSLAREILETEHKDDALNFSFKAMFTNPNYNSKKLTFILFINNRLVDSSVIKKAVEETYFTFLPKHTHPFVYLALMVKPQNIDVNVHPTKSEVHVLNEDQIVKEIQKVLESKLFECNNSRTFEVQQTIVPATITSSPKEPRNITDAPQRIIRTDSRAQPLTAFFEKNTLPQDPVQRTMDQSVPLSRHNLSNEGEDLDLTEEVSLPSALTKRKRSILNSQGSSSENCSDTSSVLLDSAEAEVDADFETPRRKQARKKTIQPVLLTSVTNLITEFESVAHKGLSELFHNFTFVGCADCNFALIQHRTKLYLTKLSTLTEKLFYQETLRKFSNLPLIRLSSPAPLRQLIILALDDEDSGWTPEEGSKEEIAEYNTNMLQSFAPMLEEYFSLQISPKGELVSLPQLVSKYVPPLEKLPFFILKLCAEVDWSEEQSCFKGIAEQLAAFYKMDVLSDVEQQSKPSYLDRKDHQSLAWKIEHLIFPALRTDFTPTKDLGSDGSVVQIACVEKLYKVFERC